MENAVPIRGRHRSPVWGRRGERSRHQSEALADTLRRTQALEEQFAELRRQHDSLRHAIFEAAHVQRKLCGPRHLRRGQFEIASEIFPVQDLSGDFISLFEIENEVIFAIGDIAGKGMAAGMWFTHLVSMLRLQCTAHRNPAVALSAMNRDLLRMRFEIPLTSLLLCRLQVKTGALAYCNAGHPPALLLHADGRVEGLSEGGPLLGALAGASFVEGKAKLRPGSRLVGYSDGIAECGNGTDSDFGRERLLAAAHAASGFNASATLFSVLGAVEDFAGGHPREDDLSLIVVHRANG